MIIVGTVRVLATEEIRSVEVEAPDYPSGFAELRDRPEGEQLIAVRVAR